MSQNPYESPTVPAPVTPEKPTPKFGSKTQAYINIGGSVGVVVGISVMFGRGIGGAIPGAFFGALGGASGALVGRGIASMVLGDRNL